MADDGSAVLAATIRRQGVGCRALGSPFYEALCEALAVEVADDTPAWRILAPFAHEPFEAAFVLRLLGGVHRMVLSGAAPAVAAHYPSTDGDGDARAAVVAINEMLEHPPQTVLEMLAVPPQTNEVGRSAALASGLLVIAKETGLPLRLREIGTSGGLNLRLDAYWYEHDGIGWGNAESPVRFVDLWRGGAPPMGAGAVIADRRACDRNPIDVTTDDGALRLLSYVWPEPHDRFVRLRDAIEIAKNTPVTIDQADAPIWLDAQLRESEPETVLVVMHSIVWQYLDDHTAAAVHNVIAEAGAASSPQQPLAWLRLEPRPVTYAPAELTLTLWAGSEPREQLLATTSFHGGPLNWTSTAD